MWETSFKGSFLKAPLTIVEFERANQQGNLGGQQSNNKDYLSKISLTKARFADRRLLLLLLLLSHGYCHS